MPTCTSLEIKKEVKEILAENEQRIQHIFGKHDQLTGEGMPGHTHVLEITDYPIKKQWLTNEVWNNPLYKMNVRKLPISRFYV